MARIDYDITCFDRVLSVEVSEQDKEKALEIIDLAYFAWCTSESCECCEESILDELTRHGIEFEHIRDYFNETMEQIENDDFESVEDAIDHIQALYKAGKITLEQRNILINQA